MKFYFLFFLSLMIFSCGSKTNISLNDYFPNKIGDHWKYQYNGEYSNSGQFITVDIVAFGALPNGQRATVWATDIIDSTGHSYVIDTAYVVMDDQKAIFYNAPCWTCTTQMPDERLRYIFPLTVNNKWFTSAFYGDTTKVLSQGDITVPAGIFHNTFALSKTLGYVTNSFTQDSIWLSPEVGLTRRSQNEFSLGPIPGNGIWKLVAYNLR